MDIMCCLLVPLNELGPNNQLNYIIAYKLMFINFVVMQDQYEFCYKTVLEYLDSFELYANFKWLSSQRDTNCIYGLFFYT